MASLFTCRILANGAAMLDKLNDDAVVYQCLTLVPRRQHRPRSLYHTQSPHANHELRTERKILRPCLRQADLARVMWRSDWCDRGHNLTKSDHGSLNQE